MAPRVTSTTRPVKIAVSDSCTSDRARITALERHVFDHRLEAVRCERASSPGGKWAHTDRGRGALSPLRLARSVCAPGEPGRGRVDPRLCGALSSEVFGRLAVSDAIIVCPFPACNGCQHPCCEGLRAIRATPTRRAGCGWSMRRRGAGGAASRTAAGIGTGRSRRVAGLGRAARSVLAPSSRYSAGRATPRRDGSACRTGPMVAVVGHRFESRERRRPHRDTDTRMTRRPRRSGRSSPRARSAMRSRSHWSYWSLNGPSRLGL